MTNNLVFLPVLVPLAAGFVLIPLRDHPRLQRPIAAAAMLIGLVLVIYQALWIRHHGMLVYQAGNWPAPFGITLAVDLFPALLMIMTMVTGSVCLLFSFRTIGEDKERHFYYPLYLIITAAINGAFATGDLFNLFVFFEIVLMTSYLLLSIGSRPAQLAETFKFLMLNSLSSVFFLLGVALLYRLVGTLNMADAALKLAQVEDKWMVTATGMVFLFTFGVKAAIVPLYFWLPRTYAAAPTAITAYLGEVGTKVGVYALYRMFTLLFIHDVDFTHKVIMIVAGITMLVGVLGAIAQMDFKRLLAFHIVSQIGYMILGLSFFRLDPAWASAAVVGVAGGIIHIVHHMAAKPALFLLAGATEQLTGTTNLKKMHGLIHTVPLVAFAFFMGGLSLTGVPPTSGFFSKFYLVQAGFRAEIYWAAALAVGVSLLTLFSMMKIFRLVYWGEPMPLKNRVQPGFHRRYLLPGVMLVSVGLIMGFGAHYLLDMTTTAAQQLLRPERYVEAVLGPEAAAEFAARLRTETVLEVAKGARTLALQQFVINLILVVVWALLQDAYDYVTLATGYLLGAAMIYVVNRMIGAPFYLVRLGKVIELVLVFLWEVVLANVRVAYQVLHPGLPVRPGFVALPLDVKTDWQISLLAILVTMTPGTLSVDVSEDRRFLVVHVLDASDPEGVKESIKQSFERRILEVTA